MRWYQDSEKWPEQHNNDILFGDDELGEMRVEWVIVAGTVDFPRLVAFDDSWSALASFTDLLGEMAKVDGENISKEQFIEILEKCGFRKLE